MEQSRNQDALVTRCTKYFFGYDLFLSYSYEDGSKYAQELESQLSDLDFTCFLDKRELHEYGDVLSNSLDRAIR